MRKQTWRAKWREKGLKPEFVRRYYYTDNDGSLCFEKQRFSLRSIETGKEVDKTFLVFSAPEPIRVGESGETSVPGLLPAYQGLMYNLTALTDALWFGHPVYVVEGEKDCERAGLAYPGDRAFTSSYQGGEAINARQAALFVKRKESQSPIRFIMDRDAIGAYVAYSNALAINLPNGIGGGVGVHSSRISFYYPKVKANKSDLADHIEAGYRLEDLVRVTGGEVAKIWKATSARLAETGGSRAARMSLGSDVWRLDGQEVNWKQICADWAERMRP